MPIQKYCVTALASAILTLCASFTAVAASATVDNLQKKYNSVASMKAEFSQMLLHKESGSKETRSGTFAFRKPLLLRWESVTPASELLLVTSKEIWNVFPDEEIAYKYSLALAEDSRSIVRVVTGQTRLDQDFLLEEESREGSLIKLRLFPKEPVQSLVEAVFWVDSGSGLIKKIRIYDFYGNENEITFLSQQIGVSLPNSLFSFTPAKGMVVEDKSRDGEAPRKPLLR